MKQIEFRAMGCRMLAAVDSDEPVAEEQICQVPEYFEAWEQSLSRFRSDSELSQLNMQAGRPVRVSKVLWDVVHLACWAAIQSDGLVTPTLLPALEAAGYDRTFEELGRSQPKAAVARKGSTNTWQDIVFNRKTRSICLLPGMQLDLGGIAKGWAADQAVKRLQAYGPALVDAGGDIAVSGPMRDGSAWPIGISNPREPDSSLELILLRSGGVATSGRDYRRWQLNGRWQHHIIDPRTGQPAETDILSATVIAPSVIQAELAAKVVFILGSKRGMAWLQARREFAGLTVLEDGRALSSDNLKNYLWNASV